MKWKNFRLRTKLLLAFGLIVIILIVLIANTLTGINKTDKSVGKKDYAFDLILTMQEKHIDHLKWANEVNKFVNDDKITKLHVEIDHKNCAFGKWYYSDERKKAEKLFPGIKDKLSEMEEPHRELHESANSIKTVYNTNKKMANEIYTNKTIPVLNNIGNLFSKVEEVFSGDINKIHTEVDNQIAGIKLNLLLFSLGAVIIALFFSLYISKKIVSPIKEFLGFTKSVSQGNLSAEMNYDSKDEIGELATALTYMNDSLKGVVEKAQAIAEGDLMINIEKRSDSDALLKALSDMVKKLREVIGTVTTSARNVSTASQEMSSSSQQISQGASEQASSTEEVSSSMEEMGSNIQQNTDNAQQTEKISTKAATDIIEGNKNVNQTLEAMNLIAEKVSIIGDIAFQTNILALNAAVEAARAGEHGKGFTVVAAEVRKLAEKSQKAASEIDELTTSSVSVANQSKKLLEEIVPDIEKTSRLVQEITAASTEQSSGAEQINNAITQLNEITQQNAATSEEMATASEELNSQSEQLLDIVSFFKVDEEDTKKTYIDRQTKHTVKKSSDSKKLTSGKDAEEVDLNGVNIDMNSERSDEDFEDF